MAAGSHRCCSASKYASAGSNFLIHCCALSAATMSAGLMTRTGAGPCLLPGRTTQLRTRQSPCKARTEPRPRRQERAAPRAIELVPTAVVVELPESVRARLRRLAPSLTAEGRQAVRAKLVLAAAEGLANAAIARELNGSVNMLRKWRGRRFAFGGLKT